MCMRAWWFLCCFLSVPKGLCQEPMAIFPHSTFPPCRFPVPQFPISPCSICSFAPLPISPLSHSPMLLFAQFHIFPFENDFPISTLPHFIISRVPQCLSSPLPQFPSSPFPQFPISTFPHSVSPCVCSHCFENSLSMACGHFILCRLCPNMILPKMFQKCLGVVGDHPQPIRSYFSKNCAK